MERFDTLDFQPPRRASAGDVFVAMDVPKEVKALGEMAAQLPQKPRIEPANFGIDERMKF